MFLVDTETRKQRIHKYAQLLEMTESLGDFIGNYSHGMKQKTALLRTLLHKPKLLVLDYAVCGAGVQESSFHLKDMMRQLCKEGSSIFFSTHVLDVAEKLCHKVAIIQKGRIVADGKMEDVKGNASLEEVFLEGVGNEK